LISSAQFLTVDILQSSPAPKDWANFQSLVVLIKWITQSAHEVIPEKQIRIVFS
jgi:hypothetical protein